MTEPRYLLDSNILLYVIAGSPDKLRERLEQEPPSAVVTSTVCVAEVMVRVDDRTHVHLTALLDRIPPWDPLESTCRHASLSIL